MNCSQDFAFIAFAVYNLAYRQAQNHLHKQSYLPADIFSVVFLKSSASRTALSSFVDISRMSCSSQRSQYAISILGIETKASSHSPHTRQRMKIAPKNTTNHSLKDYPQVLTSLFSLFKLSSRKGRGHFDLGCTASSIPCLWQILKEVFFSAFCPLYLFLPSSKTTTYRLKKEKLRFSNCANSFFSRNGDSSILCQIRRRRQHSVRTLIVFFFQPKCLVRKRCRNRHVFSRLRVPAVMLRHFHLSFPKKYTAF